MSTISPVWVGRQGWTKAHLLRDGVTRLVSGGTRSPVTLCGITAGAVEAAAPTAARCGRCLTRQAAPGGAGVSARKWFAEGYVMRQAWIVEDAEGHVIGDAPTLREARQLVADVAPRDERLDGLPDEARCGLCGDLIVASRSVNGQVTWCHTEAPDVGHEALYPPAVGGAR